jgi:hypothetical protein
MAIIADTSGILALLDRDEQYHQATVKLAESETIWVPATILPEVDYLATKHLGEQVARAFLEALLENYFTYISVEPGDLVRSLQIMTRYRDATIGLVDSSIVALAERYQTRRILTLDRRHFSLIKPQGIDYLQLLP